MSMEGNGDHQDVQGNSSRQRLQGKVAIITGGARGIGAATAKIFSTNGAHVIIADILDDLGTKLASTINGLYIHCDVSNESHLESAVNAAMKWKGRLDIIFNNAGVPGQEGSITRIDMEKVKTLTSINVLGTIHGVKHAAKAMISGGRGGSIICMSSSSALVGGLAGHPYTMTKEAILGVVRSAACELGKHRIRVNCITAHAVPSEMLVDAYKRHLGRDDITLEEVTSNVAKSASLINGRAGRGDDIAWGATFLASEEESGFITGQNLVIDGGFTMGYTNMSYIYE